MNLQRFSWRRSWSAWVTSILAMIASSTVTYVSVSLHLALVVSVVLLVLALLPVCAISLALIWIQDRMRGRN